MRILLFIVLLIIPRLLFAHNDTTCTCGVGFHKSDDLGREAVIGCNGSMAKELDKAVGVVFLAVTVSENNNVATYSTRGFPTGIEGEQTPLMGERIITGLSKQQWLDNFSLFANIECKVQR